jgi:hypothetical protein
VPAALLVYRRVQRRQRRMEATQAVLMDEVEGWKNTWTIDERDMRMVGRIDAGYEGAFGQVWRAEWQDITVAVKKLQSLWLDDPTSIEEFEKARVRCGVCCASLRSLIARARARAGGGGDGDAAAHEHCAVLRDGRVCGRRWRDRCVRVRVRRLRGGVD